MSRFKIKKPEVPRFEGVFLKKRLDSKHYLIEKFDHLYTGQLRENRNSAFSVNFKEKGCKIPAICQVTIFGTYLLHQTFEIVETKPRKY